MHGSGCRFAAAYLVLLSVLKALDRFEYLESDRANIIPSCAKSLLLKSNVAQSICKQLVTFATTEGLSVDDSVESGL